MFEKEIDNQMVSRFSWALYERENAGLDDWEAEEERLRQIADDEEDDWKMGGGW